MADVVEGAWGERGRAAAGDGGTTGLAGLNSVASVARWLRATDSNARFDYL